MANKSGTGWTEAVYTQKSRPTSTNNAFINELNKNLKLRMTRSNTISANARIVYHGPNGNAVYGNSHWGQMFESVMANAIQEFLRRISGEVTPEGFRVEPIGFHIDLKIHQPAIAASVLTFQVRK